ncbi:proline-rich protein 2-like [Canis lupus familiaris]|uniref:proline-rich protein 2-like n=1 Tax=Canis lupus familiaris TaxID=9615 RepID=UPI0018F732DD|nr:proline-rich protein 2-like [Canis lupus familiaris]
MVKEKAEARRAELPHASSAPRPPRSFVPSSRPRRAQTPLGGPTARQRGEHGRLGAPAPPARQRPQGTQPAPARRSPPPPPAPGSPPPAAPPPLPRRRRQREGRRSAPEPGRPRPEGGVQGRRPPNRGRQLPGPPPAAGPHPRPRPPGRRHPSLPETLLPAAHAALRAEGGRSRSPGGDRWRPVTMATRAAARPTPPPPPGVTHLRAPGWGPGTAGSGLQLEREGGGLGPGWRRRSPLRPRVTPSVGPACSAPAPPEGPLGSARRTAVVKRPSRAQSRAAANHRAPPRRLRTPPRGGQPGA